MSFEFLQELSEARLFRNPAKMKEIYTSELADNFFNAVLALQTLKMNDPKAAQRYAKQTLQSGSIDGWRASGSDFHNMAFMLKNQDRYEGRMIMDRHVSVPSLQLNNWIRNMALGKDDRQYDRQFLLKLQKSLAIQSPGLKSARRLVADWEHALPNERKLAASKIYQGVRHDLQASDMYNQYNKMMHKHGLFIDEIPEKRGVPFAVKVAGAAAAGYLIGKKLASL